MKRGKSPYSSKTVSVDYTTADGYAACITARNRPPISELLKNDNMTYIVQAK
jgi:hypothetical protein